MDMAHSPRNDARSRYNASFHSSIFEPFTGTTQTQFVPAGKRRDQTTSEMFGTYDEKDLRGMPKTFVPKGGGPTAHQMKQHFLSSGVLPCSNYPNRPPEPSDRRAQHAQQAALMDPDSQETVDAREKRREDLSSKLFGRKTPQVAPEQAPVRGERLTPNDFSWHSHPELLRSPRSRQQEPMSHAARAYQEKCSSVFDHRSPDAPADTDQQRMARAEEDAAEKERRANAHYSDLFGRSFGTCEQGEEVWRPRLQGTPAEQITVHQDWMDSKTELLGGARCARPEHPALRKSDELHRNRIFGEESTWQPPEKLDAMEDDNSQKLRSALGQTGQKIHQAHMRTSLRPSEFYEEAERAKQWEVVELHLSGLPSTADDKQVRRLCQGFDLHLVKVDVEMDPVGNRCKGRGKIMLRHNSQDSVINLVHRLEESSLRVEV